MTKTSLCLALMLSLAGLTGCDDPADDAPQAVVTETPESPETPPEAEEPEAAAAALAIDTGSSTFGFIGSKPTDSHEGTFETWSGEVQLSDDVTASSVTIDIQMASVQADSERLTGHLRTDDFFDVANHPTARFESSAIAAAPDGTEDANYLITGQLTLRGETRTITFPSQIDVTDAEVRAQARFSINRQEFGINYPGMEDDLIRDAVVIHFDVHAPRS